MKQAALFTGMALALVMGSALAAQPTAKGAGYEAKTERGKAAAQIVSKWAAYVRAVYGSTPLQWADAMKDTFAQADIGNLKKAATMDTYEGMIGTLVGQKVSDAKIMDQLAMADSLPVVQSLGSPAEDLVYTMVAPCRIVDTREAVGKLTGSVPRDIFVHGANFTSQGGSATNCGIPADPSAVVINIVTVTPDASGFMTVYPAGTARPNASNMNYVAGSVTANEIIAKTTIGQPSDLTIFSQAGTHLVVDIVGYFMAPKATALDCTEVASDAASVNAGGVLNVFAPACPAGYARVEVQCRPSSFGLTLAGSWTGHCNYRNDTAAAISATAASRCCRVPGR